MGWEIQEHEGVEIISHTGAYDTFSSVIGIIPEYDIGFVILLNVEDAGDALIEEGPLKLLELLCNASVL